MPMAGFWCGLLPRDRCATSNDLTKVPSTRKTAAHSLVPVVPPCVPTPAFGRASILLASGARRRPSPCGRGRGDGARRHDHTSVNTETHRSYAVASASVGAVSAGSRAASAHHPARKGGRDERLDTHATRWTGGRAGPTPTLTPSSFTVRQLEVIRGPLLRTLREHLRARKRDQEGCDYGSAVQPGKLINGRRGLPSPDTAAYGGRIIGELTEGSII